MDFVTKNRSKKTITVALFSTLALVGDCLKAMLDGSRDIAVSSVAHSHEELLQNLAKHPSDVVLICLGENEGPNVQMLPQLFKVAPQAKVILLSSPDSLLDQPVSLKLGAKGIVGADQNLRVLRRAIEQVAEGEVWLNQKLIEQLLSGSFNGNGAAKHATNGHTGTESLTSREIDVVKLVAQGMNNKDVSRHLNISEATVRHHLSAVYGKLGVDDRLNLAIYAYQYGIIKPSSEHGSANAAHPRGNGTIE